MTKNELVSSRKGWVENFKDQNQGFRLTKLTYTIYTLSISLELKCGEFKQRRNEARIT